jgi:hypothetical protein
MDITSPMGITNHMHITRGTDITGLFVARGGRGVDWSMVTIRMSGRLNIIATGRPRMAIGEHPQLIILDEPLSGLDAGTARAVKNVHSSAFLPVGPSL